MQAIRFPIIITRLNRMLITMVLMISLFLLKFSYGMKELTTHRIDSFCQFDEFPLEVPAEFEGQWMSIEASYSQVTKSLVSMTEFLFLAAEPNAILPTMAELLSQQNSFASYLQSGIHYDEEGANALRWYQTTLISDVKAGTWRVGLYDMGASLLDEFQITVRFTIFNAADIYCPESCNAISSGGSNTCRMRTFKQISSTIDSHSFCACSQGFIGKTCYFESIFSSVNDTLKLTVQSLSWQIRSFNLSQFSTANFTLRLRGSAQYLRMSIVYGAASNNSVPYFWLNSYDIQQGENGQNWQDYTVINDQMLVVFNSSFLAQQHAVYPWKDHNYDQTLTIGFYNYNPIAIVSFDMQLDVIDSELSSNQDSQKMIVILIVLCGSMVLCIVPISYCVCKTKCKALRKKLWQKICKKREQLNQTQDNCKNNDKINNIHNESSILRENQRRQLQYLQQLQEQQQQSQSQQEIRVFQIQNPPLSSGRPLGAGPSSSSRSGAINEDGERISSNTRRGQQYAPSVSSNLNSANRESSSNNDNIGAQPQPIPKKVVPVTRETIDKFMPVQLYSDIIKLYPNLKEECAECIVCLEGFELDAQCRLTPCFHLFHSECLLSWFEKHSTCPYCRAPCNKRGIIQLLHISQRNTYIKRFESPRLDTAPYGNNKEKEEQEQDDEDKYYYCNVGLKTEGNIYSNSNMGQIHQTTDNKSRMIIHSPMDGNNHSEKLERNNQNKQDIQENKKLNGMKHIFQNNNMTQQEHVFSFEDCLSSTHDLKTPQANSQYQLVDGRYFQSKHGFQDSKIKNGMMMQVNGHNSIDRIINETTQKQSLAGIDGDSINVNSNNFNNNNNNNNNINVASFSMISNNNLQQTIMGETAQGIMLSHINSPENSFYQQMSHSAIQKNQCKQLNGVKVIDELLVLDDDDNDAGQ